jgi:hypothetical protein
MSAANEILSTAGGGSDYSVELTFELELRADDRVVLS